MALLVASPYLYYDSQNGFASLLAVFGAVGGQATWDADALGYVVSLASDLGLPPLTTEVFRGEPIPRALPSLAALAGALLALGVAVCVARAIRLWRVSTADRRGAVGYMLLVVGCVLPVLLSTRHALPLYPHYFIVVYPLQFLVMGVAVSALGDLLAKATRRSVVGVKLGYVCAGAVVLALGASQVTYTAADLVNTAERGYREPFDLATLYKPGIPLVYRQAAIDGVRELRRTIGEAPVIGYAHQQELTLRYLGQPDVRVDCVEPPEMLLLPRDLTRGAILLLSSELGSPDPVRYGVIDDDGPIVPTARRLGFEEDPAKSIRGPGGDIYYRFLYLSPEKGRALAASFARPPVTPAVANGLHLAGIQTSGGACAGR